MQELEQLFAQFRAGLIGLGDFREAIAQLARRQPDLHGPISAMLLEFRQRGVLSPESHSQIERYISVPTTPQFSAEPTRALSPEAQRQRLSDLGLQVAAPPDESPTSTGTHTDWNSAFRRALKETSVALDPTASPNALEGKPSGPLAETAVPGLAPPPASPTATGSTVASGVPPTFAVGSCGDQQLNIGSILKERFVLEEVLGSGGMGVVYKALDLRKSEAMDKEPYVALKVLNPEFRDNPISLIALQREARRAQGVAHPNIIQVYDFDRDGNQVFMSMEYLTGRPLNRLVKDNPNGMSFKKAWGMIRAMAEALGYAHSRNLVHSDFKPGNVFVSEQGEIKVLDFGIACAAHRPGGKPLEVTVFNARDLNALTPAYASLEMLNSQDPDPRDDLYALGCVAYELLSGKHPYGRLSADKAAELRLQPKPISGLNRRQWRTLQRALALRREDRIRSAEEFVEGLQRHSVTQYALVVAIIAVLGITGLNVYLNYQAQHAAPASNTVVLSEDQQAKVKDLLDLAGIHFDVGYLVAPTGSNAMWAYQEVLKIDPYNSAALAGLQKIADALEQSAWDAFEHSDRVTALKRVTEGLEAMPTHPGLMELRKKLER